MNEDIQGALTPAERAAGAVAVDAFTNGGKMKVWIPQKFEIEALLQDILARLKSANKVSDIAEFLDDALVSLECHISNRADVERGKITE